MMRVVLTLLLAVMTTTTAWSHDLVSHIDFCKGAPGAVCLGGWVYDSFLKHWTLGQEIDAYAKVYTVPNEADENYDPARDGEIEFVERPDVNAAFNLAGKHGFRMKINVPTFVFDDEQVTERTFYVKIYAVANSGNGDEHVLLNSPYTAVTVRKNVGDGVYSPYRINDAGDWDAFADAIADADLSPFYASGSYELAKDENEGDGFDESYDSTIPVTKMFGTSTCPFTGHFEGNGQTLKVALSGSMHVAPFAFCHDATIQNLTVGGTINASQYAGGIVGHGGSGTLTLLNCICEATISGFSNYAGGLLGWCDDLTLNLQNSLFKGSFAPGNGGKYHPIALKNDLATATAPAAVDVYYVSSAAPSEGLGEHRIIGAEGFPVSETNEADVWDEEVTGTDEETYYAAHFTGKRLPYSYGFENDDLEAEGWTLVNGIHNSDKSIITHKSGVEGRNDFSFFFRDWEAYLISDELDCRYSGLTMSFYCFYGQSEGTLQVGYSTTTKDIDAFTWGPEIVLYENPNYIRHERSLPRGTRYVAVRCKGRYVNCKVDAFNFTSCDTPSPASITEGDVTDQYATLTWEAPDAPKAITGYSFQYKKTSESNWSTEQTTTTLTADLYDLTPDTEYDFRVRTRYADDLSPYLSMNFRTAKALPYNCGFENGMDGWTTANLYERSGIDNTEAKYNGENGFRFYSTDYAPQYLISPRLPGINEMTLSFYYMERRPSAGFWESFQVGYSTTTNDISAFIWDNGTVAIDEPWTLFEKTLPKGTKYVAVAFTNSYSAGLFLDDFCVQAHSNYEKPTDLAFTALATNEATASWTAPAGATGYAYQYKKEAEDGWSAEATVNNPSVTLSSLQMNTGYDFRVKAQYAGGNSSNYVAGRFMTEGEKVTLPYTEGFENGMGAWRMVNGYILSGINSKDTEQIYDGNCSFRFFQKNFSKDWQFLISPEIDTDKNIKVSFYYRGYLESSYFEVWYSTTTKDLANFKRIAYFTAHDDWRRGDCVLPTGTKYVAIAWSNEFLLYLDDFTFEEAILPNRPSNLAATGITAKSADVSWTGNADTYNVRWRQKPLFFEDFENGLGQWKVVRNGEGTAFSDWQQHNLAKDTENWAKAYSGTYVAASVSYYYSETDIDFHDPWALDVDNWLISPLVTLDGLLKFWVHDSGNSTEHYDVLVSTTTNDISAFTKIGSGVSYRNWTEVAFDLSSYQGAQGYVAIRHQSFGNPFIAIDDVGIYKDENWTNGVSNLNTGRLTGLQPETEYVFQVEGVYYNALTGWSDAAYFTTTDVIPLADNADNTQAIADLTDNQTHKVMLQGRTLHKDGKWNTLCLPFSMTAEQVTAQLAPTALMTLSSSSYADGTLTLAFAEATAIEAGKPYIIRWDSGDDVANPVFSSVTMSSAEASVVTDYADFIGTSSPATIYQEGEQCKLYLDDSNTLHFPTGEASQVNACRAYFVLKNDNMVGAVDGDPAISLADVTALTNIILGNDEGTTPRYNHAAADINLDNSISIADVTELISILLGKPVACPVRSIATEVGISLEAENIDNGKKMPRK